MTRVNVEKVSHSGIAQSKTTRSLDPRSIWRAITSPTVTWDCLLGERDSESNFVASLSMADEDSDSHNEDDTGDNATPSDKLLEVMPGDHISTQDIPVDMTIQELIDILAATPKLPARRANVTETVALTPAEEEVVVWDFMV
ncbi:hypothetical protein C8J56DRAFT_879944 [Mycena floridula]|nr:hypothetical protein C8J56DRAFT_879944 [Mycena floridula]